MHSFPWARKANEPRRVHEVSTGISTRAQPISGVLQEMVLERAKAKRMADVLRMWCQGVGLGRLVGDHWKGQQWVKQPVVKTKCGRKQVQPWSSGQIWYNISQSNPLKGCCSRADFGYYKCKMTGSSRRRQGQKLEICARAGVSEVPPKKLQDESKWEIWKG